MIIYTTGKYRTDCDRYLTHIVAVKQMLNSRHVSTTIRSVFTFYLTHIVAVKQMLNSRHVSTTIRSVFTSHISWL